MVVIGLKKELSARQILEDFASKTILNQTEKEVLTRYVSNETITEISLNMSLSTASVSRIIAKLKDKYKNYKKMELAKLIILQNNK